MTHHYHPKSIVHIVAHSSSCGFSGFVGQMYHDMSAPLEYHAEYFHCPKNLLSATCWVSQRLYTIPATEQEESPTSACSPPLCPPYSRNTAGCPLQPSRLGEHPPPHCARCSLMSHFSAPHLCLPSLPP